MVSSVIARGLSLKKKFEHHPRKTIKNCRSMLGIVEDRVHEHNLVKIQFTFGPEPVIWTIRFGQEWSM